MVIPTICWSDESSFDWCFDGVPKHSLISISTVGGFHSKESKAAWLTGYAKCLEVLEPSSILLFGKLFPEIEPTCDVIVVSNNNLKRKTELSVKPPRGNFSMLEALGNECLDEASTSMLGYSEEV